LAKRISIEGLFQRKINALGKTNVNKILFISFTVRGNKVRIISAIKASEKERELYAKKEKS